MSGNEQVENGKTSRTTWGRWIIRISIFVLAICLCSSATGLLLNQWQSARLGELPGGLDFTPNLNPLQRTYIGAFLAPRAAELNSSIGDGNEPVLFEISLGENAEDIAANLNQQGLIKDSQLFINYVRFYGLDSRLEAGSYRIDPQLTYPELAIRLTNAEIVDVELSFLEGWRLEEMAAYLEEVQPANIDSDQFLNIAIGRKLAESPSFEFFTSLPQDATLEGFLFPDMYKVSIDAEAEDLVLAMLTNFDNRLTPALRQAIGVRGLNLFEAVTLASIIQREAVIVDESPAIAGVFLNRLRDGMMLQADPTVQYGLGYQPLDESWWKSPLSSADLQIDSPYNTYQVNGLPPGPISNPGLRALEAVAAPLDSNYYYFVADCDPRFAGSHVFSTTYDEHLAHVERCRSANGQ